MKELYGEGVASHSSPESCVCPRKVAGEALTGGSAGQPLSCEIACIQSADAVVKAEGNTSDGVISEISEDLAQSETLSMHGHSLHGNREILEVSSMNVEGRLGKAESRTPSMHASRKSDSCVVPKKQPNKGDEKTPAEDVEERRLTEGNARQTTAVRTQCRATATDGLQRVRKATRRSKRVQFTALLHHVTPDLLRESFYRLKKEASPGVDGMTWREYELGLEDRLRDLHGRIHRGSYRARPSKRQSIPKADGKVRLLGIGSLEDKIVQQTVSTVLSVIYEEDFMNFSYGFRPGRGQHRALDALYVGIKRKKVNWVLDADIRGFFDNIDHGWLLKFLQHRIADRRILRLLRKWLKAGVSEDGKWSKTEVGTPQGAVISPLLANVFLHYVLDLWVHHWRKHKAKGDVIIVRYADDFVVGFQNQHEAKQFLSDLRTRLEKFNLALHPDKTRLIEFGRYAAERRREKGENKPETFNFLGFTHICGRTKCRRRFQVIRRTIRSRIQSKLIVLKEALMKRRHKTMESQGKWLRRVIQGHYNYYGVPGNIFSLGSFHKQVCKLWLKALRRRSQRSRLNWVRFRKIVLRWIPPPKIQHPFPEKRIYV